MDNVLSVLFHQLREGKRGLLLSWTVGRVGLSRLRRGWRRGWQSRWEQGFDDAIFPRNKLTIIGVLDECSSEYIIRILYDIELSDCMSFNGHL